MRSPTSKNQLHPRHSLRKLKTAFSSPSSTARPTTSQSPLSASTTSNQSRFSGFDFGFHFSNQSAFSLSSSPRGEFGRAIRRKKSMVEAEQEEERRCVDGQLIGLVEPRPQIGATLGGIEEVLDGRV